MAGRVIETIKDARMKEYLLENNMDKVNHIALGEKFSPIFYEIDIHPEEEGDNKKINDDIKDIANDISILDKELYSIAIEYEKIINETELRMKEVELLIAKNQEKINDMNMLCGEDSSFFDSLMIEEEHFSIPVFNEYGLITCEYIGETSGVELIVKDVRGNGMEGNAFVYKNGEFLSSLSPSNNRNHMKDNKPHTFYEYQRFSATPDEEIVFAGVNFDDAPVVVTVEFEAEYPISMLYVNSSDRNTKVTEIFVKNTQGDYVNTLEEPILIHNRDDFYQAGRNDYIYRSGVVSFPITTNIKMTFTTEGYTGEMVAFEYTPIVLGGNKDGV